MSEAITNPPASFLLKPGTLWSRSKEQTKFARESGALKSIETQYQLIEQEDILFVVRTKGNLKGKERAKKKQKQLENISSSHLCLLNKFNVVDHHLLIVTRAFEEQTDLLNLKDFAALWSCLQEIDGLAFYNGGEIAGASQRHKHLQLIPLPFMADVVHLPIAKAVANINWQNSFGTIASFPFRHAVAKLNIDPKDAFTAAKQMWQQYQRLLNKVGFELDPDSKTQPGAYNLLTTRNWMLIVPRSQDSFANIPINSLGFAGSLFVRDRNSLELLKQTTPLKLLEKVAISRKSTSLKANG